MRVELEHVTKVYPAKAGANTEAVRALDGVSISVDKGEWLAVMGPSGSGKSTLVNLIGCLDRPTSGKVVLDGQDIGSLPAAQLDRMRAEKIGLVFQQSHLIPYLTAVENVMLAQYFHSMSDESEARDALARVGLGDRAGHLPAQLSGGEQQRVAIARALINDPAILLADEPTGNLDAANEEIVLRLLRELHDQGRTIIMVTHDPVVARLADSRVELHHGHIAAQETFALADEHQFDEILEEIWIVTENGQRARVGNTEAGGALPMGFALEKMAELGLITLGAKPPEPQTSRPVVDHCHEAVHPALVSTDGELSIEFTERGRRRAADILRRHRLAERLFTETLHMQDDDEVERQACKFEHILSPEATERICSFLGHPKTCPHGSPIPPGSCCVKAGNGRQ